MAEYIEREALIQQMADNFRQGVWDGCDCGEYRITEDTILEAPAADVALVRHGRWKCNKPCPVCGEDRFKGLDADIWADWEPPYCPNCGAKMDGECDA